MFEWGECATNFVQMIDAIENRHSGLGTEIEQNISEVLLTRGDYALVRELGSLKGKLNAVRREARQS